MNQKNFYLVITIVIFSFLLFVNSTFCCTSIIVGKDATVDGSVIATHTEELGADTSQTVDVVPRIYYKPGDVVVLESGTEVPQVEMTYAYIQFNSDYNDLVDARSPYNADNPNYFNEWQVFTGDDAATARDELKTEFPPGGVSSAEIKDFIGQRAKTAREGVELAGWLIDTYGFAKSGGGGMMYVIADSNEGWWFEGLVGKHWAAMRCPDNAILMRANANRIGEIDLSDTENFLGSKNLVSYAIEKGWYDPATNEPFNFEKAYASQTNAVKASNKRREMMAVNFFAPSKKITNLEEEFPEHMIIIPDHKVSKEDCMAFQRWHYEGTEVDLTEGYELGSPHNTPERVICNSFTQSCAVAQLRSWLPNEIGGCLWLTESTPCVSVFIPWYSGITKSPDVFQGATDRYDGEKAWWRFKTIAILANADYKNLIKVIKPVWETQEKEEFELQTDIEKTALEIYQKGASYVKPFLTNYSNAWALTAYNKTNMLINECLTTLAQKGK